MHATLHQSFWCGSCPVAEPHAWLKLQDAQAGRNVIECLLRYLSKGGHWADTSSLRNIAIAITRKVHYTLSLAFGSFTA